VTVQDLREDTDTVAQDPWGATATGGTATKTSPGTTVPPRSAPMVEARRRRTGMIRGTDLLAMFGGLAAALSTTGLLWTELSPFTGVLGYVITTWVLFVVFYAVLVSFDENRPTMRDRVASLIVHSLGGVLLAALIFIVYYTLLRGWHALVHLNFFTQDLRSTGPLDPLTKGGIKHAIVGTLIEVGIALALAVPLGLLGAVFLHEIPGRFSRFVRTVVEAMTALPDILAGLFIYATLILIFGLQLSGLAAATALAVTILPIIIRTGDVVLRLVPGGLKEASYALGTGQWRTVWHILLPTARSGLATAVILGAARAIGETSPVLLTAGATGFLNTNPVRGPMMSLPLLAYIEVQSPERNEVARGFGAAATLLVLVLVLFVVARIVGGRGPGDLTGRQRRRSDRQSQRDSRRFFNRPQQSFAEPTTAFGSAPPGASGPAAAGADDRSQGGTA
jgi:phosphate transport system permease protein